MEEKEEEEEERVAKVERVSFEEPLLGRDRERERRRRKKGRRAKKTEDWKNEIGLDLTDW